MASFIYLYAKFTEEFLLLGAAGIFTLLSIYCYHWVIKKRRLGAARDLVPAGMVKVYLNQLIDEAQFVRTQLFGLIGGGPTPNLADFETLFTRNATGGAAALGGHASPSSHSSATPGETAGPIPSDLLERLHALEDQLTEKEGMVVNINIEKTKLLEEVENLKQNQNAVKPAAAAGGNDELVKKIKTLEERLEEYSLFEDDLANLKRLQQENAQLKKRVEEAGSQVAASTPVAAAPAVEATPVAAAAPVAAAPAEKTEPLIEASAAPVLDQAAIDALLNGTSPTPPAPAAENTVVAAGTAEAEQATKVDPGTADAAQNIAVDAKQDSAANTVAAPEAAVAAAPATEKAAAAPKADDFEKLVDSVETSLDLIAKDKAKPETVAAAPADAGVDATLEKSDEELLKEFENLLNS